MTATWKGETPRDGVVRWAVAQQGKGYGAYRDCSGFVAAAFRQAGITIPEGSVAQYAVGEPAHDYSSEPGLLHFWDTFGEPPGHVALGVGGGQVVHALNEQRGIVISDVHADMGGRGRYMGAARLFDDAGNPLPAFGGDAPDPKARPLHETTPSAPRRSDATASLTTGRKEADSSPSVRTTAPLKSSQDSTPRRDPEGRTRLRVLRRMAQLVKRRRR